MTKRIKLGDISVDVVLKDIKNVHLSVHPPTGRVRISAPLLMNIDTIRVFAISKLSWIKQQQKKLQQQDRETQREYVDRESHFVWGERYLFKVIESDRKPSIELKHKQMILTVRPDTDQKQRHAIVETWYRNLMRNEAQLLIAKWEPVLGVKVQQIFVQRMKTKWGSCNPGSGYIRLNTELAKKPIESLEYIVVHEMAHLLEPTHNARFVSLMGQFMPNWRFFRDQLNRLPVSHEEWVY